MARPERSFTTIKDLATHLGVSGASVSRALNDQPGVSDELRARIKRAAEQMGLHLHGPAAAMARNRTSVIGLVISTISNWFFAELAGTVERAAASRGLSVILANSDDDPKTELRYLKTMYQQRVEGIILNPAVRSRDHRAILQSAPLPIVYLDRAPRGVDDIPFVTVDPAPAIEDLVSSMVSTGRRRLAIIAGPRALPAAASRLRAFNRATRTHGLVADRSMTVYGDFSAASGARAMRKLLSVRPRPDAVFVSNNLMTRGALQALREAGVRVPEEMSLASFDDVPWFTVMNPSITAIAQPVAELGTTAVDLLQEAIAGAESRSVYLGTKLLLRESTDPQAGQR